MISVALLPSLRAWVKSEHLYKGSCYWRFNPDRCFAVLCVLRFYTQEAPGAEESGREDICRAKLFSLAYSPRVVRASCHLGNLASVESLSVLSRSRLALRKRPRSIGPRLPLRGLTPWSRAAFSSRGTEELCAVPLSLPAPRVCDGGMGEACVPGGLVPSMALPLSRKQSPGLRGVPKKMVPLCDHWLKCAFPCWWVGNRQMEAESRKVDQQMGGHFAGSDNTGFCSL